MVKLLVIHDSENDIARASVVKYVNDRIIVDAELQGDCYNIHASELAKSTVKNFDEYECDYVVVNIVGMGMRTYDALLGAGLNENKIICVKWTKDSVNKVLDNVVSGLVNDTIKFGNIRQHLETYKVLETLIKYRNDRKELSKYITKPVMSDVTRMIDIVAGIERYDEARLKDRVVRSIEKALKGESHYPDGVSLLPDCAEITLVKDIEINYKDLKMNIEFVVAGTKHSGIFKAELNDWEVVVK